MSSLKYPILRYNKNNSTFEINKNEFENTLGNFLGYKKMKKNKTFKNYIIIDYCGNKFEYLDVFFDKINFRLSGILGLLFMNPTISYKYELKEVGILEAEEFEIIKNKLLNSTKKNSYLINVGKTSEIYAVIKKSTNIKELIENMLEYS